MRSSAWFGAALAVLVPGCANDVHHAQAVAAFTTFQDALQRQDPEGCRQVLTTESATALGDMPWDRISKRKPLKVLSATQEQSEFRVQVEDPNEGGRVSEFVVVREYGRYVVDLVATAGLHVEVVETSATREQTPSHEQMVPRELTPADFDRIRRYQLAQPPR